MESHLLTRVLLKDLSKDFSFACRYRLGDAALTASIAQNGILQPLVVTQKGQIVSGHQRFQAALELGIKELPVLKMERVMTAADLYLISVVSNWKQTLSELDRAWAIRRAVIDFKYSEEKVLREIFPALGIAPQKHLLEEFLQITSLNPSILENIADEKLPFRGAKILKHFPVKDQLFFSSDVVSQISLTSNQLIKTGEWLLDLIKLSKTSLEEYILLNFAAILNGKGDLRQKAERFYAEARSLRFPSLVKRQKEFQAISAEMMKEVKGLALDSPEFFEEQGLSFHARVADREALQRFFDLLQKKQKLLNSLFDITF